MKGWRGEEGIVGVSCLGIECRRCGWAVKLLDEES